METRRKKAATRLLAWPAVLLLSAQALLVGSSAAYGYALETDALTKEAALATKAAVLSLDKDATEESLAESALDDLLGLLPESVYAEFMSDGWTISLVDDAGAACELGTATGVTDFDSKTIYLTATSSAVRGACLHEFGHYIDWKLGWASSSVGFESAYAAERDAYSAFSAHAASTEKEAFAEVMNDILLGRTSRMPCSGAMRAAVQDAMDEFQAEF